MSFSQERPVNPAKRFMKIKSGAVSYYDKEEGENVNVPTPLEFIVLDQLATIKGWSDQDESGYWSNEVRRVGQDALTIRTKNGVKETGIWKEIKGSTSLAGAKYTSSIYIMTKGRDGYEINNISLTGAALNAWIEFTQKNRVNQVKVVLSSWKDGKKGSVSYKIPVFEATEINDDERDAAVRLDKELQSYLAGYFDYVPDEEKLEEADVVVDDIDEETPINLDDIPF